MSKLQNTLDRLKGVKKTLDGYIALCPAHDDNTPSLSIADGDNGKVMLHCFAGCKYEDIRRALQSEPNAVPIRSVKISNTKKSQAFSTAEQAIKSLENNMGPHACKWEYHNSTGETICYVIRWDLREGKTFRPISMSNGNWHVGSCAELRPLYKLREIAESETIYICEGEKAADAVASLGLVATTSLGGSNAAAKSDWGPLGGKTCVVLPDNDSSGRTYANTVARLAGLLDMKPKTIKFLDLPGLPEKGDAVDWLEGQADLGTAELKNKLLMLTSEKGYQPPFVKVGPALVSFDTIEAVPVEWLWESRVALGTITLIAGMPGVGKSFLTCDMAARISNGETLPHDHHGHMGSVIIAPAEDSPEHVLKPRLEAFKANTEHIHLLKGVYETTKSGEVVILPFKLGDLKELREALRRLGNCKLVIIDPIGSFLGDQDSHRDTEVRAILTPLNQLAVEFHVAIVLVAHLRKAVSANADDMVLGSRAFTGVARTVLHLAADSKDPTRRILVPGKSNLAKQGDGLAFSISGEPAVIQWEEESFEMTADQLLRRSQEATQSPSKVDEAIEWLRRELVVSELSGNELKERAILNGIKWRTVERASKTIGVNKSPGHFGKEWIWSLPQSPPT